jgi:hypothetical protein
MEGALLQSVTRKMETHNMTFFHKLKAWLETAFKKAPAMEVMISSACNYCVPFVEQLDVFVIPEVAPVVNPILDKIKTGLAALAVTISGATTAAGTTNAKAILTSISTNLGTLLPAMQINDPNTQKEAESVVSLLQGEFAAMQAQFAAVPAA